MDAIDRLVRKAMAADRAPGVALVIVRGEETDFRVYGVREAGGAPIDAETHFAIASVSKAFTATACAALVDDGKLTFDDPVRKHLPSFRLLDPAADANVTVRDLLCHRTGLPRHDGLWYRSPWGRAEILAKMAHLKPTASYRGLYQYNNLCFLAAGEAAAAAAGEPFESYLHRRILQPLGMDNVSFSASAVSARPNHAAPHPQKDGKPYAAPFLDFTNVGPAGAMNASVRDLEKWLRFHLRGGKDIVTAKSLAETYAPQTIVPFDEISTALYPDRMFQTYGLGWLRYDWGGQLVLSHGGAIDGFRSHLAIAPKRGLGFAILSNTDGVLPDMVRNGLLDLLLGVDGPDWVATLERRRREEIAKAKADKKKLERERKRGTKPSAALDAYVGVYTDPGYGDATVTRVDGTLRLLWSRIDAPLRHWHYDQFVTTSEMTWADEKPIQFRIDANIKPVELHLLEQTFVRRV